MRRGGATEYLTVVLFFCPTGNRSPRRPLDREGGRKDVIFFGTHFQRFTPPHILVRTLDDLSKCRSAGLDRPLIILSFLRIITRFKKYCILSDLSKNGRSVLSLRRIHYCELFSIGPLLPPVRVPAHLTKAGRANNRTCHYLPYPAYPRLKLLGGSSFKLAARFPSPSHSSEVVFHPPSFFFGDLNLDALNLFLFRF